MSLNLSSESASHWRALRRATQHHDDTTLCIAVISLTPQQQKQRFDTMQQDVRYRRVGGDSQQQQPYRDDPVSARTKYCRSMVVLLLLLRLEGLSLTSFVLFLTRYAQNAPVQLESFAHAGYGHASPNTMAHTDDWKKHRTTMKASPMRVYCRRWTVAAYQPTQHYKTRVPMADIIATISMNMHGRATLGRPMKTVFG